MPGIEAPKGQVRIVSMDWRDAQVKAAVSAGRKQASIAAATAILEDANKHVPFETGTLHDSGRVDEATAGGTSTAVVSYDTPYARRLHENPQYNFRNGREGKWLEHALDRAPRGVMTVMANVFAGIFRNR